MTDGKLGDEKQELPEHKVVQAINLGGLWKITAEEFEIFCIAEKIFKKKQNRQKHVLIKYGHLIGRTVLEETSELASFLNLKDHKIFSGRAHSPVDKDIIAECTKRRVVAELSDLICFLETFYVVF